MCSSYGALIQNIWLSKARPRSNFSSCVVRAVGASLREAPSTRGLRYRRCTRAHDALLSQYTSCKSMLCLSACCGNEQNAEHLEYLPFNLHHPLPSNITPGIAKLFAATSSVIHNIAWLTPVNQSMSDAAPKELLSYSVAGSSLSLVLSKT